MGPRVQSTERGTVFCHFGVGFFYRTKMVVDVASRKFGFGFAPSCTEMFSLPNLDVEVEPYLQNLCEEASNMAT